MREIEEKAARAYAERFGVEPALVASAPGRVNLIGEHTDYNGGLVLPCAIDRRVAIAVGPAPGGKGTFFSVDFDEARLLEDGRDGSWADYPRGVAWAVEQTGVETPPFRATFAGNVPLGSGLSSSAAIEAATALALDALFGFEISGKDLALLCQKAENGFVGVPSGIMDQYASLLCEAGSALLIDCGSLEADPVPLGLEGANLVLLVCDTRVKRGLADTAYQERRETCEKAARELGVDKLREARGRRSSDASPVTSSSAPATSCVRTCGSWRRSGHCGRRTSPTSAALCTIRTSPCAKISRSRPRSSTLSLRPHARPAL